MGSRSPEGVRMDDEDELGKVEGCKMEEVG